MHDTPKPSPASLPPAAQHQPTPPEPYSTNFFFNKPAWRWPRRLLYTIVALLLLAVVLDRLFPLPLPAENSGSTVVLARDGKPLRAFPNADGIWRYPTTPQQVSPLYLDALLTYEDRWFYQHPGINPLALGRAAWQLLRHGRAVSGGSTLTMQVARILDPHSRSALGKLKQMLRALQLEAHLSKDEILTLYLDRAPFGGTIEGVEAASWAYLGKPAARLSHAEAALLAVLPQAPSRLRPDRNAAAAQRYRDKLLARMQALARWDAATVRDAALEVVAARQLDPPLDAALLAQRLRSAYPQRRSIATSIDRELQAAMEARVANYLARLPERTSAALLLVDNSTLETLAYVGSGAFGNVQRLGHVDMVRASRSPGSTLKPFLYGLAIDDGLIHSESLLVDAPQSFGGYRPGNFDMAFNGPVAAADALRLSLNVPAVDLLDRVGPARFAARLANAGLQLRWPRGASPNLALILGGTGASLEDLVGAYSAFNRSGLAGSVRLLPEQPLSERRLLSPGAAWIVRSMLEANPRPGQNRDTFDPGQRARLAWKTGTSYGFRDAWALGTTRRYTLGVWVGRPDGTPVPGQYGAVTALPLLFQAVDSLPRAAADVQGSSQPSTVSEVDICWPLGSAFEPQQPELCQQKRKAWILDGAVPPTLPEREAAAWNDRRLQLRLNAASGERLSAGCHAAQEIQRTLARWPALAQPWLTPPQRKAARLPPLQAGCSDDSLDATANLRIAGVAPGTSLVRAPGSTHAPHLSLRALGASGTVQWLINGRLAAAIDAAQSFEHDFDQAGRQTVTAMTAAGSYAQVEVQVLP
ncbi:penicillin-binding protein 1C [Tahibacter aquaticus]|uniref:peptidoglycan glycosyltransferase n=1 Tax=Tahibacter aquaticus TaxID=520092 RepID=A0A4R6YYD6_9GAMM|nr:penicillin-binding protein 1C [Tahibacter aquaticus]TDR43966.1 penicillin-binding protein 1C [Tahibacter aquaticus]